MKFVFVALWLGSSAKEEESRILIPVSRTVHIFLLLDVKFRGARARSRGSPSQVSKFLPSPTFDTQIFYQICNSLGMQGFFTRLWVFPVPLPDVPPGNEWILSLDRKITYIFLPKFNLHFESSFEFCVVILP